MSAPMMQASSEMESSNPGFKDAIAKLESAGLTAWTIAVLVIRYGYGLVPKIQDIINAIKDGSILPPVDPKP